MEDIEIIREIQNDDFSHFSDLSDRYGKICIHVGKNFIPCSSGVLSLGDLNSIKDELVFAAAKTFKEDSTSKFSTWLGCRTKYFCLDTITASKVKYNISMEECTVPEPSENPDVAGGLNIEWIKEAMGDIKNKKMLDVINYRYFNGQNKTFSFRKIAKLMDITPQRVHQIHNRFLEIMKNKLSLDNLSLV